jgi:hypothetical protein
MLLDGVIKVDITVIRMIREIRRKLDVREAQREIDSRNREIEEAWVELSKKLVLISDQHERSLAAREAQQQLTWDDLLESDLKTFTLDDAYIKWMEDELARQLADADRPFGGFKVMSAAMKEAIACLADELKYAETVESGQ